MSNKEQNIAIVNIAGREFKIKCPFDEVDELQEAARYLNNKMQEVQHGDRFIAIDRVVITAALNIAHELISEKQSVASRSSNLHALNERFTNLEKKLDQELSSSS